MASKRKPEKKNDPNQITALSWPDEDEGLFLTLTALRPTVQAAVTLKEYDKSYGDLDLNGFIAVLTEQTKASNGDRGRNRRDQRQWPVKKRYRRMLIKVLPGNC